MAPWKGSKVPHHGPKANGVHGDEAAAGVEAVPAKALPCRPLPVRAPLAMDGNIITRRISACATASAPATSERLTMTSV
jgi:hypothetical protein